MRTQWGRDAPLLLHICSHWRPCLERALSILGRIWMTGKDAESVHHLPKKASRLWVQSSLKSTRWKAQHNRNVHGCLQIRVWMIFWFLCKISTIRTYSSDAKNKVFNLNSGTKRTHFLNGWFIFQPLLNMSHSKIGILPIIPPSQLFQIPFQMGK